MKELLLYTTVGCHLCDLAKEQLEPLLDAFSFKIVEVEIADDDILLEKYGVRIPVVKINHHNNELAWPFDTEMAFHFFQENS